MSGARVDPQAAYPAGWLLGANEAGSLGDVSFMVDRADDVSAADLIGEWVFQFTRITASGVHTYHSVISSSFNSTGN